RKLAELDRSYFTLLLGKPTPRRRLPVFERLSDSAEGSEASGDEFSGNTSACSHSPATVKTGNFKNFNVCYYKETQGFFPWGNYPTHNPCFQPLMGDNLYHPEY